MTLSSSRLLPWFKKWGASSFSHSTNASLVWGCSKVVGADIKLSPYLIMTHLLSFRWPDEPNYARLRPPFQQLSRLERSPIPTVGDVVSVFAACERFHALMQRVVSLQVDKDAITNWDEGDVFYLPSCFLWINRMKGDPWQCNTSFNINLAFFPSASCSASFVVKNKTINLSTVVIKSFFRFVYEMSSTPIAIHEQFFIHCLGLPIKQGRNWPSLRSI